MFAARGLATLTPDCGDCLYSTAKMYVHRYQLVQGLLTPFVWCMNSDAFQFTVPHGSCDCACDILNSTHMLLHELTTL